MVAALPTPIFATFLQLTFGTYLELKRLSPPPRPNPSITIQDFFGSIVVVLVMVVLIVLVVIVVVVNVVIFVIIEVLAVMSISIL